MNKATLEKIEAIQNRLGRILGTVSGNFSLEQQVLKTRECSAVLLKIYQGSKDEGNRQELFALVIDDGMKMGVCSVQALRAGNNPLSVKRKYYFHEHTFAPWVKTHLITRLRANASLAA